MSIFRRIPLSLSLLEPLSAFGSVLEHWPSWTICSAWVRALTRHPAQPMLLCVQHSSICVCVACLMFLLYAGRRVLTVAGGVHHTVCWPTGVCVTCLVFLLYADWCVLTIVGGVHHRLWSDTWSNYSACTCTQTVPPRSGILSTAVRTRCHHAVTTLPPR